MHGANLLPMHSHHVRVALLCLRFVAVAFHQACTEYALHDALLVRQAIVDHPKTDIQFSVVVVVVVLRLPKRLIARQRIALAESRM